MIKINKLLRSENVLSMTNLCFPFKIKHSLATQPLKHFIPENRNKSVSAIPENIRKLF